MTEQELLTLARSLQGTTLYTAAQQKPFTVSAKGDTLQFTPGESLKPRPMSRKALEMALQEFNQTGSLKPADYQQITVNASYILALLAQAQGATGGDR
jgi:predicted component of type VI protein secretion system